MTWTLTYTLTNGPVTGAVITDPIPVGFTFLDASNGGTFANGIVTWNVRDAHRERIRDLPDDGEPGDDLSHRARR